MPMSRSTAFFFILPILVVLLPGCAGPAPEVSATSLRLIEGFSEARLESSPEALIAGGGGTWSFAGDGVEAWEVGHDVADLRVDGGLLVGRSSSEVPLIHVQRQGPLSEDLLHEVEIRARVSAGANLTFFFQKELAIPAVIGGLMGPFPASTTALLPGEEMQTYRIRPVETTAIAGTRHVILRPTDVAGADFAIESVRLISRSEHLASIPSGIGWHGLSGIYRETLVSRAPESIRFSLRLPPEPRFEVALGTLDGNPMVFRVRLHAAGSEPVELLRRTLTRPREWQDLGLDLADFAGREVELELSLQAEQDGELGFWGSPVVRNVEMPREGPGGVIVVIADTLRADRLDPYGHSRETAPHLARMAREGALFKSCLSQATWTKPSISSIMSGLYPLSHGVTGFAGRLPAAAATLAEGFREAGWATVSLSSIDFFGKSSNLHQGFEIFHESASLPDGLQAKTMRSYMDRFLPWLDDHHDVPFFAVVHGADPHSPFEPYPPYDTLFTTAGARDAHSEDVAKVQPAIRSPFRQQSAMPYRGELEQAGISPEAYVARELDWYDASIRALDAEVGRLLERLDELGIADRTVVAFVSDHGEEFLDHDRHWHGHSVYGELSQVPLVLRGPGVEAGSVIEETVQTIDLAPTLLALAGLEADERMQGQSLLPLMSAADPRPAGAASWRPQPAFSIAVAEAGAVAEAQAEGWPSESYGMLEGQWMLVHHVRRPENVAEFELYDHTADPLHQHDVAAENPEVVERLAPKIIAWKSKAEAERIADDAVLGGELDAAELERLRGLGYIN